MTTPPTTPAEGAAGVVDRCVCFERSFAALRAEYGGVAERSVDQALERIRAEVGCGGGCGLCLPYLRLALASRRDAVGLFER